jgi:hypothetical protein
MFRNVSRLMFAVLISTLTAAVYAQQSRPPGGGPPAEAFEACVGKSRGDACTVTFGDRTMKGTCEAPPPDVKDTRLSCRPSEMPRPPN